MKYAVYLFCLLVLAVLSVVLDFPSDEVAIYSAVLEKHNSEMNFVFARASPLTPSYLGLRPGFRFYFRDVDLDIPGSSDDLTPDILPRSNMMLIAAPQIRSVTLTRIAFDAEHRHAVVGIQEPNSADVFGVEKIGHRWKQTGSWLVSID